MQFAANELALILLSLRTTAGTQNGRAATGEVIKVPEKRTFEDVDQLTALTIFKKLKDVCKDGPFVDAIVELATDEKSLLLKLLKRPWGLDELEIVGSLKSKLE